jgi:hypothetical protein
MARAQVQNAYKAYAPPKRKPGLLGDIYNGAVRGDFARELGLAGALTQMILGYTPGFGTLCASRDLIADLRQRDRLGAALNFLALFPVLGGFPKTAAVIQHVHLVGRALRKTRANATDSAVPSTHQPYPNAMYPAGVPEPGRPYPAQIAAAQPDPRRGRGVQF